MMKYLTFIAPLLFKAPRKNPVQVLTGFAALGILVAAGFLAVLIGFWYFLAGRFGVDVAWLSSGIVMLLGALAIYFMLLTPRKEPQPAPYDVKTDPIGELIPKQLRDDPTVAKILEQIDEHPMGAMAAAIAVGTVVGREMFGADLANRIVVKT